MRTLLYQLTVIDRKGKVLVEEICTSPSILAKKMPLIQQEAEKLQKEQITERLEDSNEKN